MQEKCHATAAQKVTSGITLGGLDLQNPCRRTVALVDAGWYECAFKKNECVSVGRQGDEHFLFAMGFGTSG